MPYNRTLQEVLNAHGDAVRDSVRKCLPATITAVNPARRTVDVQIAIQNPRFDEFGEASFEELPSIKDVPLGFPSGGGFLIWVPVQPGDNVMLIFSDLSMDTWRAAPPGGPSVRPGWVGKHSHDSPWAIPCVAPDTNVFATPPTDPNKLIIGKDGSPAQIRISASEIDLAAIPTSPMALANGTQAAISALQTEVTAIGVYIAALTAAFLANPALYAPTAAAMGAPGTAVAAALVAGAVAVPAASATVPATLSRGA